MTSEYTLDLIKNHGWKFVVSHDVNDQAVPDCYVNDDTNDVVYSIDEVLNKITESSN